ncbi:cytochrome P450 9e2-like [Periplaneta americana]|uniref:cytochrome P450 9e2-like n=1 Tax=Periplaneta americana TaxID=6978 RepID=UPI0037E7E59B
MEIPSLGSWWAIAILALGGLLYLYLTWSHDYWKKRGVPYVKPLPFFGNLKDSLLMKKQLGEVYEDMYWKLDGYKYGGVFKFGQPVVLIRDPELIKTVLVKDFGSFHDNDVETDVDQDPMFGRNPFVLKGERWKITRSQVTPALSQGKIKPYFPLIAELCEELKQCIEKSGPSGTEFEVKELCARFTTDVVASCAYGIRGNALQDPDCEFRRMGRDMLEPSFWKNIRFMIIIFLPRLARFLRLGFATPKVQEFFRRIIREVTTYREKNNITRYDYLQHLITLKAKGTIADDDATNGHDPKEFSPEKNIFTEDDVIAQATTFFGDGYETSSASMAFALYCLATNPDCQAKVRQEVDDVLKKYGGELTFDGLQEMTYLDMAVNESLRLYPPGTVLLKKCTKPFRLETPSGGSFELEAGTPVAVPLYAIHRDPQHFPDPMRFDPERFTEENKKARHRQTFFPFGDGPRMCLGYRFAMMMIKVGIASLLSNFELRPCSRTPVPIVPDPTYFILAAKGGLWFQVVKRTDK